MIPLLVLTTKDVQQEFVALILWFVMMMMLVRLVITVKNLEGVFILTWTVMMVMHVLSMIDV